MMETQRQEAEVLFSAFETFLEGIDQ